MNQKILDKAKHFRKMNWFLAVGCIIFGAIIQNIWFGTAKDIFFYLFLCGALSLIWSAETVYYFLKDIAEEE